MLKPLLYLLIAVLVEIPSGLGNTTVSIMALSIVTKHKDSQYIEHKNIQHNDTQLKDNLVTDTQQNKT
jgi:hypothetical protein